MYKFKLNNLSIWIKVSLTSYSTATSLYTYGVCRVCVRAFLCYSTTLSYLTLQTFSSIWMRKSFVPYLLRWIGLLKTVCSTENFERAHLAVNGHGHAKTERDRVKQRGNGNQHQCILRRLLRFVSFQLFTFCEHEHRSYCLVTTITDNETILEPCSRS